jgi:hypothetical protein
MRVRGLFRLAAAGYEECARSSPCSEFAPDLVLGRAAGLPWCVATSGLLGVLDSYLVDPASSHMLVSKIKPCMCKYKLFCTVKLRMAH